MKPMLEMAVVKFGRRTRGEIMMKAMLQVAIVKHGRRRTRDVKVTIRANKSHNSGNKSHVREIRSQILGF